MKELQELKKLKREFKDDKHAIQVFDKLCKESEKAYKNFRIGIGLVLIGVFFIISSFAFYYLVLMRLLALIVMVIGFLFFLSGALMYMGYYWSKEDVADDELRYLNALLKEKTMISEKRIPISEKDNQYFIDDGGELKYIGKVYGELKTECRKMSYKKIDDWDGFAPTRYIVATDFYYEY